MILVCNLTSVIWRNQGGSIGFFDRARSGYEDRASFRSVNTQNRHGGSKRWHGYYLKRCANTV